MINVKVAYYMSTELVLVKIFELFNTKAVKINTQIALRDILFMSSNSNKNLQIYL